MIPITKASRKVCLRSFAQSNLSPHHDLTKKLYGRAVLRSNPFSHLGWGEAKFLRERMLVLHNHVSS